jgi:hypothetical protein
MNIQLPTPPELARVLNRAVKSLTVEQRARLVRHLAKLIVIDGEVWYIDMDMKQEGA